MRAIVELLDGGQARSRISGETARLPLKTYETVLRATPARSAICAIVASFNGVISPDFLTAFS